MWLAVPSTAEKKQKCFGLRVNNVRFQNRLHTCLSLKVKKAKIQSDLGIELKFVVVLADSRHILCALLIHTIQNGCHCYLTVTNTKVVTTP